MSLRGMSPEERRAFRAALAHEEALDALAPRLVFDELSPDQRAQAIEIVARTAARTGLPAEYHEAQARQWRYRVDEDGAVRRAGIH